MNLERQINIIDGLIAEDHDATIADYFELVKELKLIEDNERDYQTTNNNNTYAAAQ